MTIYDFQEQLRLGKLGEDKVFKYLKGLKQTIIVWNLSNFKMFQGFGIDGLMVEDIGLFSAVFFDVKTDFNHHRNGKLFIEILSNQEEGREGGILSTKANVFYYYDPFTGDMFTLPVYAMKKWYERSGVSMTHHVATNKWGQETSGVSISPLDLEMDGVLVSTVNIGKLPNLFQNI